MLVTRPGSSEPRDNAVRVKFLSQRGWLRDRTLARRLPGSNLEQQGVTFTTQETSAADVVIIQNYLRYDSSIESRKGFIWKWDNEPIVNDSIDRGYDRVFTHLSINSPKVVTAPPILDWWVDKSYDELDTISCPEKPLTISAIASTKDWIAGHRLRGEFVERAISEFPEMDVFGRGREREVEDKWEGLAPYRYSLAIENTSKEDYWTEKISDCFLSYTVPFYWGATNISDYFPEQSYIWLPIDRPDEAIEIIRETLATDEWDKRLPALIEARTRVLKRFSLHAQVTRLIEENRAEILAAPMITKKVKGRRTRPGGWIRGAGLVGNVRARLNRRNARLRSAHS